MMMDFPDLIRKWSLQISGVLHIGARIGEEAEDYAAAGISNVWWVEGNPAVMPKLRAKVNPFGHKVIEALVWEEDGATKTFNVTNLDGLSSSMLEFGTHKQFSPDMVFEQRLELPTRTVDSLVAEHGITGTNLLCMDLQGCELSALKGATKFIDQVDYIMTEVNQDEVYVGCARVEALDAHLSDFERVETYWVGTQGWGDGLYVRRPPITKSEAAPILSEARMEAALSGTGPAVIIPSYNCGEWIERCLTSVASQDPQPIRVIVIDDASTDPGYSEKVSAVCKELGFTFVRNETNRKCPYNIWLAMQMLGDLAPETPIFLLDGDDFLPEKNVLSRIMAHYQDPNVWLSYGNYVPFPRDTGQTLASAYPPEIIQQRSFRTAGAHFNHPLTFRKFLFDQLTPADMQTNDGRWFRGGYDRVIMVPMLEMAAPNHFKFINETLYAYNAVNPQSDSSVNVDLVEESRDIWNRPVKDQLIR